MINDVIARLCTIDALQSAEAAHLMEEDAIAQYDEGKTPFVLLYYGQTLYEPSESTMHIRQITDKRLVVLLFCEVSDSDDLERQVVETVIGYQKDQKHVGMNAINAATVDISGPAMVRRIEFSTETRVYQSE